jgi:protein-S-isoprenylcysteine O-methyltransferase Ste14
MWPWLFEAPWAVFGLWWLVRAFSTARTARAENPRQRVAVIFLIGMGVLFFMMPPEPLRRQLWWPSTPLLCVALAVETAGIAFAIVAREYLGSMWSGRVTLKEDHRIVQSGPYRIVRHPIYTGVLTAVLGAVLARGNLAALAAFVFIAVGLARKIVAEEALLREHFGAAYDDYRKKVAAIIPFIL